ncbi:MAG: nucleotidyl transferase AbiEii/AbiGii toxin family protein [Deltaproteobacteria bacterium]|nr:nucleotidyl transferase AbiEii/AbiGii toxin family protein [Deltaproteobacteria bacterium]
MTSEPSRLEALMIEVMNHLADRFGNHAILKGGMVLRLLDSPRHTNDLDYVFVPYSSKKDIKDDLVEALRTIPDCVVSCSLNSKCLRCIVRSGQEALQVEVQAEMECKSQALSNADLARAHNQQGRIIRVMHLDAALAHKLAAWNERELMRDLYDAYFLWQVAGVKPALEVLAKRLERIESRRPGKAKPTRMTVTQFADALDAAAGKLDPEAVSAELGDYLERIELAGLDKKIQIALRKIAEWLRTPQTQPDRLDERAP